jgi:isoleucyl-tRNA synthetase
VLTEGEFDLALLPTEGSASTALRGNDTVVALDVEVTDELEAEGTARDLVRLVQQARKDADLAVTDRIDLALGLPADLATTLAPWLDVVAGEVLATSITVVEPGHTVGAVTSDGTLAGQAITFAFTVV